jgi:hypothetical protein
MSVDFTKIFSPAPKYMRALNGMFLGTNHDIIVDALDSQSTDEKLERKWALWIKSITKESFDRIDQNMGVPVQQEELLPQTRQELELYSSLSTAKLRYEVAGEQVAIHTEEIGELDEIMLKTITDLATINCCFVADVIDNDTYKVKPIYIDPEDIIIEYNKKSDYTNSRFAAFPEYITIQDLKRHFPDKTDEDFKKLAITFSGMYGNPIYDKLTNSEYYSFRIPILHGYWKTIDNIEREDNIEIPKDKVRKSEVKSGKLKEIEDRYYKLVNRVIHKVGAVYEAHWVMGTDLVYDYGRISEDCGKLPVHGYMIPG